MNLSQIISKTIKFCNKNLSTDDKTLNYLIEQRKLTQETINKFELGLFPKDLRPLFNIVDPKLLREANIIKNASKSTFQTWDLVMPIRDVYGNYIAISGRTQLGEEERKARNLSKYMNSIYKKSQHLFGLNFAKQSILENNIVYVVEGPFDTISPSQHNISNVVGVCGKYLSMRQIALLARFTNRIILILDNEKEAQDCAQRTIDKRKYDDIIIVARNPFPEGIKDLDEFLKERKVEEVISALRG